MKAIVQRVRRANVAVDGQVVGEIGEGLVALVGISKTDSEKESAWLAKKIAGLRLFRGEKGTPELSVQDINGAVLAISNFTVYGDCRKGRRPSFIEAASGDVAEPLFDSYVESLRAEGVPVETGHFGAMMDVELINDGPVTVIVSTEHMSC